MSLEELEGLAAKYVSFPQIARELNVTPYRAHNWAKHFHFFEKHMILGKPLVLKEDFEKFKKERPDLKRKPRKAKQARANKRIQ